MCMTSNWWISVCTFAKFAISRVPLWCVSLLISPLFCGGCGNDVSKLASPSYEVEDGDITARVVLLCGACHTVPDPASFPKDQWYHEVRQGFDFYLASGRTDLVLPPLNDVVTWFRSRAPTNLTLMRFASSETSVRWHRETLRAPSVRHVSHVEFVAGVRAQLIISDMKADSVSQFDFSSGRFGVSTNVKASSPACVAITDLNGDGKVDYVVAELGTYLPGDHNFGRVSWLNAAADGTWKRTSLLEGVGRIADVRPADIDNDGDVDLLVAEFGWRRTGRILLLRQESQMFDQLRFRLEVLDERHGAIHLPVADIDADGDLDFVALVSQEFEEVDAFLNLGNGVFERQIIHLAGDPSFGSSGIQLVDFDRDGDLDVLYTNGDSLDSKYIKPYHGVRWLENTGDFPFISHQIATLPGASRAIATDIDRDGDLDVVASAWIPDDLRNSEDREDLYECLLWFERKSGEHFERHVMIETRRFGYLAIDASDFDGDGDIDIVAGWFGGPIQGDTGSVDIFWQR